MPCTRCLRHGDPIHAQESEEMTHLQK
eukprot:COSAG01_NODE_18052_length_1103_cov_2.639442_1_plen_26_part_10